MASKDSFSTIRVEGGLISSDYLRQIASGNGQVPGLSPDAYHLSSGQRLSDAISNAWNIMRGQWTAFKDALNDLPQKDHAIGLTRDRVLLPLFQELGYGRLLVAKATNINGIDYPISHLWGQCPIHLMGWNVPIDKRSSGVAGASHTNPHSLVQQFLNVSENHLWGFVSNGHLLRVLRDNKTLARQSFIEFDLEAMLDGEVFSDFAVLFLLCHQSRVEAEKPHECCLEHWVQAAAQSGTRALEQLRYGVEEAIREIGQGFLDEPSNTRLLDLLRSEELSSDEYFRQILRTIYRLLFLLVSEERGLLLPLSTPAVMREIYDRHYSISRLRDLSAKRVGSRHWDLWEGLRIVFQGLFSGLPELGLPGLNSFLWSREATDALENCRLSNRRLLTAIRHLVYITEGNTKQRIDYKNLGSAELGSIYENVLELHPSFESQAGRITFEAASASERSETRSHYTQPALVDCLYDQALEPLLNQAASATKPDEALLALKVCDPACGSGHFLVAASRRIAKRLAFVRTGEIEPSPTEIQSALREVIGRCVYGVDLNPMAIELCKVSLWLEALEPGKPLSFLDHHIKVGNSVLGATPAQIAGSIPDEVFTALEGDDKAFVSSLRRTNRDARENSNLLLFTGEIVWQAFARVQDGVVHIEQIGDDTVDEIRRKQQAYEALLVGLDYRNQKLVADAFCAAFTVVKTRDAGPVITQEEFFQIRNDPARCPESLREKVNAEAARYSFFHWHLEFPDVFKRPENIQERASAWTGGFDCAVGNPPWDQLSPDVKRFFSKYDPSIRNADKGQQTAIANRLLENPVIAQKWISYRRSLLSSVSFFKESGRYRLFAEGNLGKGDFNIFRMFVETALMITRPDGYLGQIVPEAFYNGANCAAIREAMYSETSLQCVLGFVNTREVWFKSVDSRQKFCLYASRLTGETTEFRVAFNLKDPAELQEAVNRNALRLPVSLIKEFSPEALSIMELGNQTTIDVAQRLYEAWPRFGDTSGAPPLRTYMREVDMGNDRDLFTENAAGVPLYEGRMVDAFDHRAKGYYSGRGRTAIWEELPFGSPKKAIRPQWRILETDLPHKVMGRASKYRIAYNKVTSPTNERSLYAALLPPGVVAGDVVPTILFDEGWEWMYMVWLSVANSFACDWLVRRKVTLHLTYTTLDTIPFPRISAEHSIARQLVPLALRLTCCGPEMIDYWNARAAEGWVEAVCSDGGAPGVENENERLRIRAKIDAIVARDVFGLNVNEMEYVLTDFPTLAKRQIDRYNEFLTKRLILEAMAAN
jgi:hypothetical protein